jgi:hypothetical protein
MRVVTIVDRGVQQAKLLTTEPKIQAELYAISVLTLTTQIYPTFISSSMQVRMATMNLRRPILRLHSMGPSRRGRLFFNLRKRRIMAAQFTAGTI